MGGYIIPLPMAYPKNVQVDRALKKLKQIIMKAIWNGILLAESEETVVIEGNHYFPPDSVNWSFFEKSETHSVCPWKGTASYHTIIVNGDKNKDAALYYPEPKYAAKKLKNHIAFWKGVDVVK